MSTKIKPKEIWIPDKYNDAIEHLNGVPWTQAKKPFFIHRCWAQTRGWVQLLYISRCPCGAIKDQIDNEWFDRNTRR